ncbi:hypothetical protein [Streptomyces sp. NBC_00304]|uniref:hypothetical protein n=1 Tax=Streptomyces sp. NBC_00304 TaxID=2975706 RepID=UPI002E2A7D21|nr:hypothetical protein [Streptomyces sp. NBC_00304]
MRTSRTGGKDQDDWGDIMRQLMSRFSRGAAVLTAVLGLGLVLAPSASAGGPTSMLVTSPDTGRTTAVPVTDKRFDELGALLGQSGQGDTERPPSLDEAVGTRQINIVWMALDITPSRIDRAFPGDDPDTVWIHTATEMPSTYRGYWHRAAKPKELLALFTDLGLLGERSNKSGYTALFPREWEDTAAYPAQDVRDTATAPSSASGGHGPSEADGRWWAIPGLAAGGALVLGAQWWTRRREGGPGASGRGGEATGTGPRQQLLDL